MRRQTSARSTQTHRPTLTLAGRLAAALAVVAMLLGSVPFGARAEDGDEWTAPTTVYVEATGHTVSEPFLDVWRERQAYLGDPVSEPVKRKIGFGVVAEKTRTVQYFQNAALVQTKDDERGDRWDVQALPLGKSALERDRDGLATAAVAAAGSCKGLSAGDCRRFSETGHTVRWGFKDYWEHNGGQQLIGFPISEETKAAGGWSVQYFERGVLKWTEARGVVPSATGERFVKVESIRTTKVKRPSGIPVYEESIFQAPAVVEEIEEVAAPGTPSGPGPQQGGYKEIVVSVADEYMWAYEDGQVVIESYVSTGTAGTPETTTPPGFWAINTKLDSQTMEGTISGEFYSVPDVPYVMYFDNAGNALHGTYWHNNFGTPMSHGCVNLPMDVAAFIYGWAEVGTAVTIL